MNDPNDIEAFVRAVLSKDKGMTMWYLYEGNPEDSNAEGFTPLTALLIKGSQMSREQMPSDTQEELVNMFAQAGAKFNRPDRKGNYPIFAALFADFPVALKVFNNADVTRRTPEKNVNLIMMAAGIGLEEVINFVSSDFNLDAKDADGNTAMHHAVIADRQFVSRMKQSEPRDVVSTLCELGADPTLDNNAGKTPYEIAFETGKFDAALILKHCSLPKEGMHKIKIKLNPDAEASDFYVHDKDTVLEVKRAILFEDAENFHFVFPRFKAQPQMDDMREFSDYAIRDGDLITVLPKMQTGARKGGRRTKTKTKKQKRVSKKRRSTRRN